MKMALFLREVKNLAHEIHYRDRRIISGVPYINHPTAVARTLEHLRFSGVLIATGWLHDSAEDHPESWPFDEIERFLLSRNVHEQYVLRLMPNLRAVTYDDSYGSRRERLEHYREAISTNPEVIPVVLADKLDNLDDIITNLRFRRNVFGANYLNRDPREEIKNWLAIASICYEHGISDRRIELMANKVIEHTETIKSILHI